jgi:phosphonate transport system substrate-binding protein
MKLSFDIHQTGGGEAYKSPSNPASFFCPAVYFPYKRKERTMKRNLWLVALVLVSLALVLAGCGEPDLGTEGNPIVMSFVPSGDTQDIIASGDELAAMIKGRTGLEIQANVGTDFAAVREAMGAEQAHIGWLNTFNYVLANEKYGVEAALVTLRFGLTTYRGQINVRADSGITTLEDLKGKVFCWVDPNSTSGYIIPRIMLLANGIDPDTDFAQQVEAGSHNNVVTQVYNGDCDAGATYDDARSSIEEDYPDVKEQVVILEYTQDIPNDNVSFIKEFPADMREQIVVALLEIAQTPEGQAALDTLYSIEGLEEADDSFYDGFRATLSQAGIDIEELAQ